MQILPIVSLIINNTHHPPPMATCHPRAGPVTQDTLGGATCCIVYSLYTTNRFCQLQLQHDHISLVSGGGVCRP